MRAPIRWLIGATVLLPGLVGSQTIGLPNPYLAIVERNVFGLKAAPPVSVPSPAATMEPQEDLLLTGLIEMAGSRRALFELVGPGKHTSFFTMREGEQNEWMEVKSVNIRENTVNALLKKPLARSRNVGAELVISFQNDARKNRTVGDNRGNPHVDNSGTGQRAGAAN